MRGVLKVGILCLRGAFLGLSSEYDFSVGKCFRGVWSKAARLWLAHHKFWQQDSSVDKVVQDVLWTDFSHEMKKYVDWVNLELDLGIHVQTCD
ncbi:hypothetical protein RYX36_019648 [Vicia faba]